MPGTPFDDLLGRKPCACGTCRRVDTERVTVTRSLADATARELDGRDAFLIGDPHTLAACGAVLAGQLREAGVGVDVLDLSRDGTAPHADQSTVDTLQRALARPNGTTVPVAVGAGTINDLVKAASHALGTRYVAIATAPSMNGYPSAIAAITVDGLKSTLPSTPPIAVLADPDVLAASPVRLAVSGLADLLSKPVSTADWKLGHVLWDQPFCAYPADLAGRAVEAAAGQVEGIAAGEVDARRTLFDAVVLSGISMAVAGSSSPASGGEHLISHFLDMTAAHETDGPREPALHGEQVGVATRATTRLYSAVLGLDESEIDWNRAERAAPDVTTVRSRIEQHTWIPASLREQFVRESAAKLDRIGRPPERVARIRQRWSRAVEELRPDIELAQRYVRVLPAAGAPVDPTDLGVSPDAFRTAYRLARFTRDRYTILDLADDLGLLHSE